jgi:hypothetical protein
VLAKQGLLDEGLALVRIQGASKDIALGHEAPARKQVVVHSLGLATMLAQARVHCPEACEVGIEAGMAGAHLCDDAALAPVQILVPAERALARGVLSKFAKRMPTRDEDHTSPQLRATHFLCEAFMAAMLIGRSCKARRVWEVQMTRLPIHRLVSFDISMATRNPRDVELESVSLPFQVAKSLVEDLNQVLPVQVGDRTDGGLVVDERA